MGYARVVGFVDLCNIGSIFNGETSSPNEREYIKKVRCIKTPHHSAHIAKKFSYFSNFSCFKRRMEVIIHFVYNTHIANIIIVIKNSKTPKMIPQARDLAFKITHEYLV